MRHRILTCKNHPHLRWSTKDCAWTEGAGYNGSRSIFYSGTPTGQGMYGDGSGLHCQYTEPECSCPATDLILAPEDALVKREE